MSKSLATNVQPEFKVRASAWFGAFSAWCDVMARYFARRSAIKHLHELNDRALRDIGIERSQIKAAVRDFIIDPDRGRM
jgi:uncharacterized protein YjiS (DUF1127 family)